VFNEKAAVTAIGLEVLSTKGKHLILFATMALNSQQIRLNLNQRQAGLKVFPAKSGSIMIMEYFKKAKPLDFRLEKPGLFFRFELVPAQFFLLCSFDPVDAGHCNLRASTCECYIISEISYIIHTFFVAINPCIREKDNPPSF